MNIPNSLTLFRIALIPIFVLAFYLPFAWINIACTLVFGLAAVTDWLDGYLARKLGQTSAFGAFLDPVADKLMVAVVLVLLVQADPHAWIAVPSAIIIGREIAVSALREWMAGVGKRSAVAVMTIGKVKTTIQMIAILFMLYKHDVSIFPTYGVGVTLLYVAAVLTLWSMLVYMKGVWPALMNGASDHDAGTVSRLDTHMTRTTIRGPTARE